MKLIHLRIPAIIIFLFFSGQLFTQTGSTPFKDVFSADSLAGFDEVAQKNNALSMGLYGEEFKAYMAQQKRGYINGKYNFQFVDPEIVKVSQYRYSGSTIFSAPCVNEGFESGNFTGWAVTEGTNGVVGTVTNTACNNNLCPTPIGTGPVASVVPTPYFDAYLNLTIPNSPFPGSKVAKLNTVSLAGPYPFEVVRIAQNFPVTVNNSLYDFAYYAVMDVTSPHNCCEQPYMYVKMRDCFGNLLPTCPVFSITVPGTGCAGTGPTSWITTSTFARSNGWQRYSIDLAQYIGCSITIEVTVGHCQYGGHYGYAYYDSGCNTMDFSVNSNTVSAPSPAPVTATVPCAGTATISGPSGLGPYLWNGPPGSGVVTNTNQSIVVTAAGQYSVSMSPVGICNPINRIISLNFPPPTTINVTPTSSICTSGSVTSSTITANGPAIYSWTPGGATSSSIVVSPSVTTIYTLEAKTGTCIGTFTRQISVNQTPTVNILPSNTALCPGQTGTLSAIGASTYVWFPGGMVGSTVAITQTATTTYTAIGTSSAGCTDTETVTIGMNGAPVVSAIVFGPTLVCAGSVVTLAGFGAASFTWMPGLLTSNPQTVTPYVTTTYTAIGASGTCTNLATVTVSADPGPSLAAAASPTLICPGYNSTLTAFGSAALGYTWMPGSSATPSIVVAPFVPTTYSVFSNNALGCISLYTLAPVINPVPIMTISPASPSVCYGSALTLTATGGSTYTWSPGSVTGSAVAMSPTTSTTYTIVGSNGTCTSSITKSLSVVPLPTLSASSSTASICSGQTLTLSATGASQYTWMPGTMTASSVVISPTVTTTYTVTGNTAACETSTTITIVVNNGPTLTAVASPTAICPGFTSTLSSSGAVSYTWNPGAVTSSVSTVSPAATTIYTVAGETIFGCLSTKTLSLLVNPVPTVNPASSTPSICVGSTASLTATGGVSYTWTPGSLTGSNVAVSPGTTTNYSVVGSNSLGCTNQKTITLTVVPNPTVSPVANSASICTGFSSTLSATGANNYTWNPGALSGSSAIVSPTISTTYSLVGNTAGCTNTSTVLLTVNYGPTLTTVASPTAICPGFTSTLSAPGAVSYTWNPGALSGSAIAVSPAVTTNYTVTGATAFGCLTTKTVSLLVNLISTVNPVASSPSICIGSTTSLSATGAITFTWNPGNLTGSNVAVSPTTTTTYTVIGTNATGCTDQRTLAVTVVPLPTVSAVSNPTAICNGFSSTLTASGASTYIWNPGALTGSSAVVAPTVSTTFTVTGSTAACASTSTVLLVVNYGPTLTPVASPTAICPGFTSTLSSTGAVSYTWNPGAITGSSTVVSPPAGTSVYSVTGETSFGCLTTNTLSLLVNPTPTITPSLSSPSICVGSSATLSAIGASTYTWNPGALSGSAVAVSPTTTTTYTVDANSAVGCAGQNTITLIVVPNPTVSPVSNPVAICTGFSSTLSATGATNYTWSPGAMTGSSAIVSPTLTTTYTLVGNTAGCTGNSTVLVTVNYGPTLTPVASPTAICPGFTSTLSSTGAVSYTWNPGAITGSSTVVSPPAGTSVYSVTGATAFGCLTTNTLSLLANPTPTITPSLSSPSICVGSSATLSAIGASTYTWNPGALSGSAVAVSPTTTTNYTVAASSSAGCAGQNTITLIVVPNPTVSPVSNPVAICTGFSSTLSATGATNYTWTPGAMTGSSVVVSPTLTTTYTLVGNTAGCTGNSTVLVTVNYGPTLTPVASPTAICPGFTSTLSSTGAVSYTWNPGAITGSSTIVSPPAGTSVYSVTGATAFGCLTTNTISLLVNPTPTLTPSISSPSICVGSSATLSAIGASTYTWNPGALSGSAVAVSPTTTTTYTVDATSSAGCAGQNTITLIVVPNPTVSPVSNPVAICTGFSSTLSATGATNYTWTPGAMTGSSAVVSPTLTTTYTLVGNTAGCTGSSTVLLTVNYGPTLTAVASPTAICPGFTSTLSSTGAVSYTWNPGALTGSAITVSPPAGTSIYSITGATAFGCLTTNTVSLLVNPTPTITTSLSSPSICVGSSATLSAIGAPTYTWNPGALSGSAVAVSPTTTTNYTVAATSSAGCAGQNTITLIVVPNPTVSPLANPVAICTGFSSTLSATGATNYTWTPGAMTGSSAVVSPTLTTTYTLVGNTAGCTGSSTVLVTVNYGPTLTAVASPTAICPGFTSTLSSTGAVSYTWNPGAITASFTVVSPPAGTSVYSVTGATAFGCLTTNTLSLLVNSTPTITPSLSSPSICVGSSATLSAIGASTYTWNPGALSGSTVAVSPTTNTNYTVAATSSAGCAGQNTITLIVVPNPTVTVASNPTAVCIGASATLSALGANTYTWLPGAMTGSSAIVSPLSTTIYTVTGVTLACSNTKTVSLTINPLPTLTVSSTANPICSTNSATLSGAGAVSYTWNPGSIAASSIAVTPPSTTVYTLSGTSSLTCQNVLVYTLTVNPTPTLVPSASSPTICAGATTSLSVTGAVNYTFNPGGLTGSMVTVSPSLSTSYTILGNTGFCSSTQTVQVTVNPLPVIVSGSTPTNLCTGSTASLTAGGAATYTWLPGNVSGSLVTVNPMTTTIYTINATSALGCLNSSTMSLFVSVSPTVSAVSSSTVVCAGTPATLTANGATTYTWLPGALSGSAVVVSPTVNATYTVTGGNGTICFHTITITMSVNPLPPVLASTTNTSICNGGSVTLSASGAVNYTWSAGSATTPTIALTPTLTGTYTLTGTDANNCTNLSVVGVTVYNNPTITAAASPSTICDGNTSTLTATGATTYTWLPGTSLIGSPATVTPSLSTTYTVTGTDVNGCIDTETTSVNVLPNPIFTVSASSPSICIGGTETLTANGALNYTWIPGGINSATAIVNPTVTTTYTAIATNTTVCFTAITTTVFVNPLPGNVTATAQGMITCASQTANLLASSTSSNLSYNWNGPLSFTSSAQNPTAVTVWGGFTVTVTNTITGCVAAATTTVLTDYSIPLVTQSPSLMLTCAVPVGTLLTVHTTTNPGYSWTGPAGYTSTAPSPTVTVRGNYSLTITDLTSGCTGTALVSVGIHTAVVATASIAPATCSAGLSLNNGTIKVFNFIATHKYSLVTGSSYTGTANYTTAISIPSTGVISNTLANPTNTLAYTLRLFDVEGCIKDTVLILQPINCVITTLGLAKAVSPPVSNIDGSYDITYTITAKSYDTTSFNNVSLTDKLNLAFPSPLTFTVVNPPAPINGSGLNLNAAFDGLTNFSLTTAASSTMAPGSSTSFSFTVKVKTNSFFKPYYNSVVGVVRNGIGATVRDTSNIGFDTSPQKNVATSVSFTPYVSFGLTKEGQHVIQNNNTIDVSYTVSVHNLGNDTLKHVVLRDSLLATVQQPANFTLKSGPVTSGGLIANTTFDGIYDLNLLSSENILPPGAIGRVSFVINVIPDTVTVLINSAYGSARHRPYSSPAGFLSIADISNDGTKPDANNNGNCNEPSDNRPTVLKLPATYTLFIPEGFSPDGDNINDQFVIKGLPRGGNSSLTIFNRWGNRVFYTENYSETTPWDGTPNIAGTFGKEKLPQGTYYYILEMKGSENRTVTGFIVLQY